MWCPPAQAARLRNCERRDRARSLRLSARPWVSSCDAYALALKKLTGVEIEKTLPTPNIPLANIPECQKYLDEGSHRRLYTWTQDDYKEIAGSGLTTMSPFRTIPRDRSK